MLRVSTLASILLALLTFTSLILPISAAPAPWKGKVKRLSTTMTCDLVMRASEPLSAGDESLRQSVWDVTDQAVVEAAGDDSGAHRIKDIDDPEDTILPISPNKYTVHSHIRLDEEDDDDVYEFVYYFEKKLPGKEWVDQGGVGWAVEGAECSDD